MESATCAGRHTCADIYHSKGLETCDSTSWDELNQSWNIQAAEHPTQMVKK